MPMYRGPPSLMTPEGSCLSQDLCTEDQFQVRAPPCLSYSGCHQHCALGPATSRRMWLCGVYQGQDNVCTRYNLFCAKANINDSQCDQKWVVNNHAQWEILGVVTTLITLWTQRQSELKKGQSIYRSSPRFGFCLFQLSLCKPAAFL